MMADREPTTKLRRERCPACVPGSARASLARIVRWACNLTRSTPRTRSAPSAQSFATTEAACGRDSRRRRASSGWRFDPQDERVIVARGEQSGRVSRDGGGSWRPLPVRGGMVTWTRQLGLVAVDVEGVIRSASEPTGGWHEVGRLPGMPAALEGVDERTRETTGTLREPIHARAARRERRGQRP